MKDIEWKELFRELYDFRIKYKNAEISELNKASNEMMKKYWENQNICKIITGIVIQMVGDMPNEKQ